MKYLVGAGAIIGGVVLIAASGNSLPGFEHEQRTADSQSKQLPPTVTWSDCQDSELGVLKQVAVAGSDVPSATSAPARPTAPLPSKELVESTWSLFSPPLASARGELIANRLASPTPVPQPITQVRQFDHGGPVPSVPTLTHFGLLGGGDIFFFTVEGPPGARYFLETSNDLKNWTTSPEGETTGGVNPPSGFVTKDVSGERFFVRVNLP